MQLSHPVSTGDKKEGVAQKGRHFGINTTNQPSRSHVKGNVQETHTAKRALAWKTNTFAAFSRSNKVFTSCLCM